MVLSASMTTAFQWKLFWNNFFMIFWLLLNYILRWNQSTVCLVVANPYPITKILQPETWYVFRKKKKDLFSTCTIYYIWQLILEHLSKVSNYILILGVWNNLPRLYYFEWQTVINKTLFFWLSNVSVAVAAQSNFKVNRKYIIKHL